MHAVVSRQLTQRRGRSISANDQAAFAGALHACYVTVTISTAHAIIVLSSKDESDNALLQVGKHSLLLIEAYLPTKKHMSESGGLDTLS